MPLRSELLKLRTTRTTLGLLLGAIGLVGLTTVVPLIVSDSDAATDLSLYDEETQRAIFLSPSAATLFAALVGVLSFTSEFRHGTIRPTLVFVPARLRVVVAKLAAAMVAGAVIGITAVAVTDAVALPWLQAKDAPRLLSNDELAKVALGVVAASILWAALGVGVGALVRSQVAAIVALIAWGVVESLLLAFVPRVGELTPGEAANALGGAGGDRLSPLGGLVALVVWTAVFALLGAIATQRRDVP